MDDDNLIYSLKWIRDAIADYIWPEKSHAHRDSHEWITWQYDQVVGQTYGLRVEIEENVTDT